MGKLILTIFVVCFIFLQLLDTPVAAQKNRPLGEQSQEVIRNGDVIQVGTQSKIDTTTSANGSESSALATTSTSSAQPSSNNSSSATASGFIRPQGFALSLTSYVNWLLTTIIVLALLLAFAQFIIAGFEWITSGGDKSKTESSRSRIVHVFIGILVLSASYAIIQFIAYLLGFGTLNEALSNIRRIN